MTTTTMNSTATATAGTTIHLEQRYAHARTKVWRALTVPDVMKKWLMRPEGFAPVVGTRFKFIDDGPHKGWRGYVDCEVLAVEPDRLLVISWQGDEKHRPMTVTFRLDDDGAGCKLTFDHEGFAGFGGWVLARFMMGPGWKGMLRKRLPAAIDGDEIACASH